MVFSKLTILPWLSATRPSSRICKNKLNTSGCAFSISSSNITEYGFLLTFSVSWPASSYPTYPGGEPINFETECFSIYSDISILISDSSLSNITSAIVLTSSVFPTPVGPANINDTGRFLVVISALPRLIARETASTASFWPITRSWIRDSRLRSFVDSSSVKRCTGILVHPSITAAISSNVISAFLASFSAVSMSFSTLSFSVFKLAIFSKSPSSVAVSISSSMTSSLSSNNLTS